VYVLFIVLNEPEYLPEVLFKMKQLGIRGATVIDSMGATAINKDIYSIPVIGGLMKTIDGDTQYNKTVFSVIEREEQVDCVMNHIEKILGGDMKRPNKGIMFVLPVTHMRGGELERHIESRENKKLMAKEFESEYY
jgi:nitrogen regulatory protein PII